MCLSRSYLCKNDSEHFRHCFGIFSSCVVLTWCLKSLPIRKDLSQSWQWCLLPSWCSRALCLFIKCLLLKHWSHCLHWKLSCTFLWILMTCLCRKYGDGNGSLQRRHCSTLLTAPVMVQTAVTGGVCTEYFSKRLRLHTFTGKKDEKKRTRSPWLINFRFVP